MNLILRDLRTVIDTVLSEINRLLQTYQAIEKIEPLLTAYERLTKLYKELSNEKEA